MNEESAMRGSEGGDAELVSRYQDGDDQALTTLFERYRLPLYAYFNRMLGGDKMSADDLFQELWIKVMRKIAGYNEQGKWNAWLFRIARNLVLEHFRRNKTRNKIGFLTENGELPETAGEHLGNPEEELAVGELQARLEALLLQLTPEQREVFHLRQAQMSFKQIAELQGCPINTVLGRMHCAIKFLKPRLREY